MIAAAPRMAPFLPLDPTRARTAARTAIACVLSLWVVLIYRFPEGYWALITCLVMTQASVGASLEKGLSRVAGTLGACLLAVVVLTPLNQDPLPFLLLTFTIIGFAAYLGTGSYHPYAFVIGGVTMVIVAVLGFQGQNTASSVGLARTGEVLVGVVISWFTAFAMWPTRAALQLDQETRGAITAIEEAFLAARAALFARRRATDAERRHLEAIGPAVRNLLALVPAAAREGRLERRRAGAERRLAIHLERLRAALAPLTEPIGNGPDESLDLVEPEVRRWLDALRHAWPPLSGDDPAPAIAALDEAREARRALEARLEGIRASGDLVRLSTEESLALHGTLGAFREVENALDAVARTRAEIRSGGDALAQPIDSASWSPALDPPRLKYAVKTGVAVCLAIYLLNLLQWGGSVSAMITTFIVAQLNIGGSVRKAFLRLSGALLGGLLAIAVILCVTPYVTTVPPFAVVVFVVLFFSAYAFTGPERSSYAGLQTGLAFVIVLVAGPKQETSMMPAVNRLVGVVLGTGISIGVETLLWPTHAFIDLRDRVRSGLEAAGAEFRELAVVFRGERLDRDTLLARTRAARDRLAGVWQILGEAMLEGRQARAAVAFDLPVASATEELHHRIARLAMRIDHPVPPVLRSAIGPALDEHLARVEAALASLPARLDGGHSAEEVSRHADALREAQVRLLAGVEVARRDERLRDIPEIEVSELFALLDALLRISQGVVVIGGILSRPLPA